MKKTVVLATMALIGVLACKKEMNPVVKTATPTHNYMDGDWTAFEEYKTTETDDTVLLEELEDDLLRFNNEYEMGTCSLQRAIFLLEGGINMLNPDAHEEWTGEQLDTNYYELSLASEMVDEFELRAAIASLHSAIASTVTSTTKHIATDIKVSTLDEESVVLIALSYYATGTNSTSWQLNNSLSLAAIPFNIKAGVSEKCGGYSGYTPGAVYTCGIEAFKNTTKI